MKKSLAEAFLIILLSFCIVFAEGVAAPVTIMQGTLFATDIYSIDSGKEGPTVVVVGGIHGDETAGILAADALTGLLPVKGRLVVIPRANRPACEGKVRTDYYMEDINRSFPGDKGRGYSGYVAAMLTEAIAGYQPSIIIDLHESRERYGEEATALGQSLVLSELGDCAGIVLDILDGLNEKVGEENEFTFASGAPAGSLNRELSELLNIPAVTVETWSGQDIDTRVSNHVFTVRAILKYYGMLE